MQVVVYIVNFDCTVFSYIYSEDSKIIKKNLEKVVHNFSKIYYFCNIIYKGLLRELQFAPLTFGQNAILYTCFLKLHIASIYFKILSTCTILAIFH